MVLIHIFTQQVTGTKPRRNTYFKEYNLYNKQKGSLKSIKKVFVFILELRLESSSTSKKMTSQNLKKPSSLESNTKRFSNVRKSKGLHNIVFDKCGCLFVFFFFLLPRRVALAVKAPSPKHWTAREFPKWGIRDVGLDFFFFFFGS